MNTTNPITPSLTFNANRGGHHANYQTLESTRRLDPPETLSPGQAEEIDRVHRAYPHPNDDEFVAEHLDARLR